MGILGNKGLKGYTFFTTQLNIVEKMECKVCGSICDENRGVLGPMGFAQALAHSKTLHDEFSCPYSEEKWHEQALGLFQEIEKSNSPALKQIMNDDLKKIIENKGV